MDREEPGSDPGSSWLGSLFSVNGWALLVGCALSRLYLGLVLSLAVIALIPVLLGWHGTVVQSGSMEPHISAGDVVLAVTPEPGAPVPVGGVVEYTSPASAEPSGVEKTRLHRVVAENPDGTFVTAGDANADVDSTPLVPQQITGQARLLVPMIGLPGLWLGTGNLPLLAGWSVLTLLTLVMALFGSRRIHENEETPDREHETFLPSSTDPEHAGGSRTWRSGVGVGVLVALAGLVIATATAYSSAAFTASTVNATNTFSAAPDWTAPSVTMISPEPSISAATNLTAEASDTETGIRSVTIEYLPSTSTAWTAVCTVTTTPYTCAWNTQGVPDGEYTIRATALNTIGLTATSTGVSTTVANAFTVALTDPGEIQRGTVSLTPTVSGAGSRTYAVRVEYALAGTNRWSALCMNLAAPYNCSWNTTAFANDYYDLRAVAVSGSGSGSTETYSEIITDVLVDNLAPVVTMNDPGTPLSGTRTFTATATDAHSGVVQTQIQYSRTGSTAWTVLCTVEVAPYSCRFDTTTLPYGSYNVRAIATDAAGISTTSATITNRLVDNTVASVSVEDPGAYLTGTIRLTAAANSSSGIRQVLIQTAPSGTTTWTTRCTLTASPLACDWDTRGTADGLYDLRAVLTDNNARTTTSALIPQRRVDNSPLRGADVQTTNRTGTPGTVGEGDSIVFSFSQQINPATVTTGWNGAALPVTVRLRDGSLLGLGNAEDVVDVQRSGTTVHLGTLNTRQNYIRNRSTATFNATMTATTITTNGVPHTTVTLTLGTTASGASNLRTTTTPAAMIWTPSATVISTSGIRSSNTPVTETGALDRDF